MPTPTPLPSGLLPLLTLSILLFIATQMIGYFLSAWVLVTLKERWWGPVRFQLQLRTVLVLSVIASVFLYLNTNVHSDSQLQQTTFGFPETVFIHWNGPFWLTLLRSFFFANVAYGLGTLLAVALVCENILWCRKDSSYAHPAKAEVPPVPSVPLTIGERVVHGLPMIFVFSILLLSGDVTEFALTFIKQYNLAYYGVLDYVHAISAFLRANGIACALLLMGMSALYFGEIARRRRTILVFNFALLLVLYAFLFALSIGLVSAFFMGLGSSSK